MQGIGDVSCKYVCLIYIYIIFLEKKISLKCFTKRAKAFVKVVLLCFWDYFYPSGKGCIRRDTKFGSMVLDQLIPECDSSILDVNHLKFEKVR